jgi:hypothetical protein
MHGNRVSVHGGSPTILVNTVGDHRGKQATRKGMYTRVHHGAKDKAVTDFEWSGFIEDPQDLQ